jgi:hypothetical protein
MKFLFLNQPGEDKTALMSHPDLDMSKFWTMSKKRIDDMIRGLSPELLAERDTFKRRVWYDDDEDKSEADSGIYHFGWNHHVHGARVRTTYSVVHLCKEKFDWDGDKGWAVPKKQYEALYFLSSRGWEWKAAPYYRDDWTRFNPGPLPSPACKSKRAREEEDGDTRKHWHAGTPPGSPPPDA